MVKKRRKEIQGSTGAAAGDELRNYEQIKGELR